MDDRPRGILLAAGGMVLLSTDSLFIRLAEIGTFDVVFWVGAMTAVVMLGAAPPLGGWRRTDVVRLDGPERRSRRCPTSPYNPGTTRRGALRSTPWLRRMRTTAFNASLLEARRLPDLVRAGGPMLGLAGLLQGLTVICFVVAVQETSVSNVTVIVAAAPLVTAVLSWLLLREHTPRRVWLAIAATAVGVSVVISGSLGGGSVVGDAFAVGAIVIFGVLTVQLRRYASMSRPVVVGLGGLVMAMVAWGPASFDGYSGQTWFALVAMGAVVGPLARVMITTAPRYLPATEVTLFAPVETVLATLWAYLAFDEAPASRTWLGGVVIVGAVLWGVWPRRPTT